MLRDVTTGVECSGIYLSPNFVQNPRSLLVGCKGVASRIGIQVDTSAYFLGIELDKKFSRPCLVSSADEILAYSLEPFLAYWAFFFRVDPAFHAEITPFRLSGKERIIILDRSQFHQIPHSHFYSGLLG